MSTFLNIIKLLNSQQVAIANIYAAENQSIKYDMKNKIT